MDYEEYINKNIFMPLNMQHSYVDYSKSEKDNLIPGYRNYFGLMLKQKYKYPAKDSRSVWSIPAGYIISSAEDMGKYLQMYLNKGKSIFTIIFNAILPIILLILPKILGVSLAIVFSFVPDIGGDISNWNNDFIYYWLLKVKIFTAKIIQIINKM